eukprot:TRINITY_DN7044_c0_g2_i1.p2 TRINITY_DN7044_c0_g2~~TRINITY_DN7044_c0_g2_i1.p2  ORF type:complete len:220 (-),score=24.10 TRINITY_DN7044_c0_g2_i1:177-836(-)
MNFNMGLANDSQGNLIWVDTYAYEFSRDVEPTVEGGNFIWEMTTSCVSLYKSGQSCKDSPTSLCCLTNQTDIFSNVWSLVNRNGDDYLLTENEVEKTQLLKEGWKEICHPFKGSTTFCVDTDMTDGRQSPFIIYKVNYQEFVPLYRCINSQQKHFISTQTDCEGEQVDHLLGYLSSSKGSETLRSLRRCKLSNDKPYIKMHSLELDCDVADTQILGFVR